MIDIKRTLKKAGMTQTELADELSLMYPKERVISKQRVSWWATKSIPLKWHEILLEYCELRGIFVYHVKSD
jgi:transcriptional regulator with XRE-family HTH domain